MYELDEETFTRLVVREIEILGNTTLSNPDNTETFPIRVISNTMRSIRTTEDGIPIYTRFSITVECWANSKYEAMSMNQQTILLLRESNFTPIGSPIDIYDDITKKHRYGSRYEVNYNGLTNSFERIL